jgi:hypothetical protein
MKVILLTTNNASGEIQMKNSKHTIKTFCETLFFLLLTAQFAQAAPQDQARFLGQWQCQMSYMGSTGPASPVSFDQSGTAVLANQRFSYVLLSPNILRLQDQRGNSDYQYTFSGNNLTLTYQDGSTFFCTRGGGGGALGSRGNQNSMPQPQAQQSSGNEWQLQGTLCNWSGSSSSYGSSSYSSTRMISFDGRGHWNFGSESSFSGSAGMAYGGQGNENSGTYRIQGNQIYYSTSSGERGVAQVYFRQDNGRITEIKVDGAVYATSLCD